MSRILSDLTQKPVGRRFAEALVVDRGHDLPMPTTPDHAASEFAGYKMGEFRLAERVKTSAERQAIEKSFANTRAPAPGRVRVENRPRGPRMYRPQDQRHVQTRYVIFDRETGQELARVRGRAHHVEIEAEKLARSQGAQLSDLKIVFEGELA